MWRSRNHEKQKKWRQESRTEHDGHCVDFGVEGAPPFPRFGPGVDVKHLFLSRGKKKEIREFEDSFIRWDTLSGDPLGNKSAGTCGTNVPLDLVAHVCPDISGLKGPRLGFSSTGAKWNSKVDVLWDIWDQRGTLPARSLGLFVSGGVTAKSTPRLVWRLWRSPVWIGHGGIYRVLFPRHYNINDSFCWVASFRKCITEAQIHSGLFLAFLIFYNRFISFDLQNVYRQRLRAKAAKFLWLRMKIIPSSCCATYAETILKLSGHVTLHFSQWSDTDQSVLTHLKLYFIYIWLCRWSFLGW